MWMRSYIRCRRDEPEHGSGRRGEGRKREVRNCGTCSCTLTEEVVEDGINTKNDSTRLARPGVCGGARAAFSRAAQPPARRAGQQKLTTWSGREKRRRGETRSTACSAAWQEAADRKEKKESRTRGVGMGAESNPVVCGCGRGGARARRGSQTHAVGRKGDDRSARSL